MRSTGGFTLIEVMVVLVLTSLIGAMLMRWQIQQEQSFVSLDKRLIKQEQQATAVAYLRRDLTKADTLLSALSDVAAGPQVLIASRHRRDAAGYAASDTQVIVYQVLEGAVRRTLLASDASVLAQPVGKLPGGSEFTFFGPAGEALSPAASDRARSVRIGGYTFRLGGEGAP